MNMTPEITNGLNLSPDWNSSAPISIEERAATPFSNIFQDTVGQVDALDKQAQAAAVDLMTGKGADVHQAVIAAQKADMAFELAISVRNKAVQAYQSVMTMQF